MSEPAKEVCAFCGGVVVHHQFILQYITKKFYPVCKDCDQWVKDQFITRSATTTQQLIDDATTRGANK